MRSVRESCVDSKRDESPQLSAELTSVAANIMNRELLWKTASGTQESWEWVALKYAGCLL